MIVVVALALALGIQAFLVKPYRIPSESMVPTLEVGQRVLVNRIGSRFSDPDVGDIVVFHPPAGAEQGNQCGGGPDPHVLSVWRRWAGGRRPRRRPSDPRSGRRCG